MLAGAARRSRVQIVWGRALAAGGTQISRASSASSAARGRMLCLHYIHAGQHPTRLASTGHHWAHASSVGAGGGRPASPASASTVPAVLAAGLRRAPRPGAAAGGDGRGVPGRWWAGLGASRGGQGCRQVQEEIGSVSRVLRAAALWPDAPLTGPSRRPGYRPVDQTSHKTAAAAAASAVPGL